MGDRVKQVWANVRLLRRIFSATAASLRLEYREGELAATLRRVRKKKTLTFSRDWSYGRLLRWAAETYGERPFVDFGGEALSFQRLYLEASAWARALQALGLQAGDGVAMMLANHPDFLKLFFAIELIGAYAVPINTELRSDGLRYLLEHSEVKVVFADLESAREKLAPLHDKIASVRAYYRAGASAGDADDDPCPWLERFAIKAEQMVPFEEVPTSPSAPCLLMYTSGTTGLPKAVTYRNGATNIKKLGFASRLFFRRDDKLYTCLPLFHANALMVTVVQALWMGLPVRISSRFSASAFWQEIRESQATSFNALGAIIPILLKTPPSPDDKQHRVRLVISSACPADAWRAFESRFGVEIWEAYGAVDGGGVVVFNAGNAPVGSIGKPLGNRYRLVDSDGKDVGLGESGELLFFTGKEKERAVSYFKDDKASNDKVKEGWLHTGDVMRQDAQGFLYFVGRLTDSMRRRGENVSAYEVEKEVDTHPAVLESAVFGVPSELGEEEIMVCVCLADGQALDPATLRPYLSKRLARYALPRYLRILDQLPKTATHRIIKDGLKRAGITGDTIDLLAVEDG